MASYGDQDTEAAKKQKILTVRHGHCVDLPI